MSETESHVRPTAEPRSVRLVTAILLVVTFATGTLTGVGITVWLNPSHRGHPQPPKFGPLPLEELDLTQEQQAKVKAIFDRHRPEIEAAVRETFPKVQAINEQTEREVKEILTDAQKQRFEELKKRRKHHGPRPPGEPWMAPGGPGGPRGAPPPPSGDTSPPAPPSADAPLPAPTGS
ncbi:MAG: Spy/CpxP family protein refolding chaperone [Polyangiaceae bacterium]